ncbi:FCD domain-containing protein [Streptomyces sp. NBC_01260]|uniref:FCD domain-containing protein n=1 Tax=Streptomyces laculatispora TaxID=887464 RepID=A0ABY9IE16_9ACTN|nr:MULTISPECIES: FCD domain-containing protein [Streptomyces]WLQ45168.1 FCD domain-containing protein [Streptomyces laculatispora]
MTDGVEPFRSHLRAFRLSSVRAAEDPTPAEHERVVRRVPRRKADRAAEAMTEHLTLSLILRRQLAGETEG